MKYEKTYVHLINEMNQVNAIKDNTTFDMNAYLTKYAKQNFLENPSKDDVDDYTLETDTFLLSNGKEVYATVEDCSFSWSWDPGQDGGWTDPSWPAGVEEVYHTTFNCYRDLNNKKNDELIIVTDADSGEEILFSSLSLVDRAAVIAALVEETYKDDFDDRLVDRANEIVEDNKQQAACDRYEEEYYERHGRYPW